MNTFDPKRFAKFLASLELSQSELSRAMKVTRQYINAYASGRKETPPSNTFLDGIAKCTGLKPEYVYAKAGKLTKGAWEKVVRELLVDKSS